MKTDMMEAIAEAVNILADRADNIGDIVQAIAKMSRTAVEAFSMMAVSSEEDKNTYYSAVDRLEDIYISVTESNISTSIEALAALTALARVVERTFDILMYATSRTKGMVNQ